MIHCTKKKYAVVTGQSISTIEQAVTSGKLPIMPKESRNGAVLINLSLCLKNPMHNVVCKQCLTLSVMSVAVDTYLGSYADSR